MTKWKLPNAEPDWHDITTDEAAEQYLMDTIMGAVYRQGAIMHYKLSRSHGDSVTDSLQASMEYIQQLSKKILNRLTK